MIFTDGPFLTAADLIEMEGEIPTVASAQNIDVNKTISAATREIGSWLLGRMQSFGGGQADPVLTWHRSSYAPAGTANENRPRVSLSQVVVTDAELPDFRTSLATLCLYESLFQFYRNASRMADTDRYEEKRDQYHKEIIDKYRPRLMAEGVPVVGIPMPAPAALWEPGSGHFDAYDISDVEGGSITEETDIEIALTYLIPGSVNTESAPSQRVSYMVLPNTQPRISIARLKPPMGKSKSTQMPRVLVMNHKATHYNVWAGAAGNTLFLQNENPVALTTTEYTITMPMQTSVPVGVGQYADRYLSMPTLRMRG